jgi:hypothetical protein
MDTVFYRIGGTSGEGCQLGEKKHEKYDLTYNFSIRFINKLL